MFREKTEIVLCKKNLTALMFSLKAVQTLFGQDIVFKSSEIHKPADTQDDYEIIICAVLPMWTENFNCSTFFTASVIFTQDASESPKVVGDVRVELLNGLGTQDGKELILQVTNGELTPTARSQTQLDELRQRIAPYRQPR